MVSRFLPIFVATLFLNAMLLGNVESARLTKFANSRIQTNSANTRIIGGQQAAAGQFPYQLQLRYNDAHFCGAVLILSPETGRQLALTAAHCVTFDNSTRQIPVNRFTLVAGITGVNETGQSMSIQRMNVHPDYHPLDSNGSPGDIAMLKLSGQFTLNSVVQPITLPSRGQPTAGDVVVSGWGVTNPKSQKASPVLRFVQIHVVNSDTCNAWYRQSGGGPNMIHSTNFCAGSEQGGKGSCAGDSGGPVVGKANGENYLAGVVSWGAEDCNAPRSPSVSTRVSTYMSWITNVSNKY